MMWNGDTNRQLNRACNKEVNKSTKLTRNKRQTMKYIKWEVLEVGDGWSCRKAKNLPYPP